MKKNGKKTSINDLAIMVNRGFNSVTENMGKRFDSVEKQLNNLEQGQEAIRLRLDNVAYRFELVELQKRVDVLEKKVGVKSK